MKEFKRLGDLAYIGLGFTHTPQYVENGIPFLSVKDITSGKIVWDDIKFISKEEYLSAPTGAKPQKGDILFCRVGTMGKPVIIDVDFPFCTFVSLGYLHITDSNTNSKYVKYWMESQSFTAQIESNVKGGTIKNLNTGWLKNFKLPLTTLSEQEKIVKELDLLSGIIEKQKLQLKELDTLAQSIFYSMFGDPVTNEKGWDIKKLGEVTITPNKLENKQINSDLLVSFLPMEDVKINSIYQIPKQSKKLSALTKGSYNYFSNQDVLLAKVTPCFENGKCCVVKDLINQIGFGSSELIAFRCQESILPLYLYFYFHSPTFISNGIKNLRGTSGLRRIQKNYLQKVSISIPPISLQNEFAEKIENIEKQKEAINKSIEETQKLFDYTMDKYFG